MSCDVFALETMVAVLSTAMNTGPGTLSELMVLVSGVDSK